MLLVWLQLLMTINATRCIYGLASGQRRADKRRESLMARSHAHSPLPQLESNSLATL